MNSISKLTLPFLAAALLFCAPARAQHISVKTNALGWATASPNLGVEFGLGNKTSLDLYGSYNPFTFSGDRKFKHWLVQPELRFWTCERFNRFFYGVHLLGGEYNVSKWEMPFGVWPSLADHRYQGYFYGAGVGIGYQWPVGNRWGIEAEIGGGYVRAYYEKYDCTTCSPLLEKGYKNYFGPTKMAVSVVLYIK